MRSYFRIAGRYLTKYRARSGMLVLSIVLCVMAVTILGSLNESSKNAEVKYCQKISGKQHIIFRSINWETLTKIRAHRNIKTMATMAYFDEWAGPNRLNVNLLAADKKILHMENTSLIAGKFPTRSDEIAIEPWVLNRLRLSPQVGQYLEVSLHDQGKTEKYKLVGLVKDRMDAKSSGQLEAYVAFTEENLRNRSNYLNVLVEFKPGTDISSEINLMCRDLGVNINNRDHVMPNSVLLEALGEREAIDWELIKISLMLMLVGGMVIYSIYSISLLRRVQDYGMMRAIGATSRQIACVALCEIVIIYILGLGLGLVSGTALMQLFKGITVGLLSHNGGVPLDNVVISSFAIKLAVLVGLGALLAAGIQAVIMAARVSPIDAINRMVRNDYNIVRGSSNCLERLVGIPHKITLKNLKRNKTAAAFMIVAMSIGGILFMVNSFELAFYDQGRNYAEWAFPTRDSDFRLNVNNSIPMCAGYSRQQIEDLEKLPQISDTFAVQMLYTRLKLTSNQINGQYGKNYIKAWNERESKFEKPLDGSGEGPNDKFAFAFTDQKKDEVIIRGNVMGLSEDQLNSMGKVLVKGKMDINEMKQKPVAVLWVPKVSSKGSLNPDYTGKTIMRPALNVRVGDAITLTFPRKGFEQSMDNWKLIFQYNKYKSLYIDRDVTVVGITETLPEQDLYHLGSNTVPYLIVSNQMFKKLSGIDKYRVVDIDMKEGFSENDYRLAREKVQEIADLIPGTLMGDKVPILRDEEKTRRELMILYAAIATVLILIGSLSVYTNIYYQLISRLREYGIMKAIGMSGRQFTKMVHLEGLMYGLLTAFFSWLAALIIEFGIFLHARHEILQYHTFDYKFIFDWKSFMLVIAIDLVIGYLATLIPARQVDRIEITEAIRAVE